MLNQDAINQSTKMEVQVFGSWLRLVQGAELVNDLFPIWKVS